MRGSHFCRAARTNADGLFELGQLSGVTSVRVKPANSAFFAEKTFNLLADVVTFNLLADVVRAAVPHPVQRAERLEAARGVIRRAVFERHQQDGDVQTGLRGDRDAAARRQHRVHRRRAVCARVAAREGRHRLQLPAGRLRAVQLAHPAAVAGHAAADHIGEADQGRRRRGGAAERRQRVHARARGGELAAARLHAVPAAVRADALPGRGGLCDAEQQRVHGDGALRRGAHVHSEPRQEERGQVQRCTSRRSCSESTRRRSRRST